jgi:DNA-binding response OmpR family regulator
MLITRMLDERERPAHERGFVRPNELVARLSLETSLPREDHVRHLVRRLRRGLAKAGIESLIETRYGVGYRFRGTPSLV